MRTRLILLAVSLSSFLAFAQGDSTLGLDEGSLPGPELLCRSALHEDVKIKVYESGYPGPYVEFFKSTRFGEKKLEQIGCESLRASIDSDPRRHVKRCIGVFYQIEIYPESQGSHRSLAHVNPLDKTRRLLDRSKQKVFTCIRYVEL